MGCAPTGGHSSNDRLQCSAPERFGVEMRSLTTEYGLTGKASHRASELFGQATKSVWWMPWRQKAMKDVISCDKLRRAANRPRPADFRMGKPGRGHTLSA